MRASKDEQQRRLAEIPEELARLEALHKQARRCCPAAVADGREPRQLEAAT